MDPEVFLEQEDVHLLIQALNTFALEVDSATHRKNILMNAGIDWAFLSKLIFEVNPSLFANQLVAHFRDYRVLAQRPMYHPMVRVLEYLLQSHTLEDYDRKLFTRLIRQSQENFSGLMARRAVGRIESPPGTARGTGVLIDKQLLLTCKHVFERIIDSGPDLGWVRFGYKMGRYGVELGDLFELDMKQVTNDSHQSDNTIDYALVSIMGKPEYAVARLYSGVPSTIQPVRLIHHPRGEPVQISEAGQIVQLEKEYIQHTIKTDYGSSGGPIFDSSWRVIAIHRGNLSFDRSYAPGATEAIPLYSIWNEIKPHLSLTNS